MTIFSPRGVRAPVRPHRRDPRRRPAPSRATAGQPRAPDMHHPGDKANRLCLVPAGRPRIPELVRIAARRFSGRAHARADARARARGWAVTETPGWLGLNGRSYRDPRFAARHSTASARARRDERHE